MTNTIFKFTPKYFSRTTHQSVLISNFISRLILFFLIFFGLTNCGNSTESQSTATAANVSSNSSSALNTNLSFSFHLSLQLDATDDNFDMTANFPDAYTINLSLDTNGNLQVMANDIDRMVYRACSLESTRTDCDYRTDAFGGGEFAADLVVDSCGRLIDDTECGSADTTVYSGSLDDTGNMTLDDVSIRLRLFMVENSASGYSAADTDAGLIPINRLITTLTTNAVTSGTLKASGTIITNTAATLVASGSVSSTTEVIGGARFIATLSGNFDSAPLSLLGK